MRDLVTAFIGLGSNLANPALQIELACRALNKNEKIMVVATSPYYRSQAIGPEQPDFINAVTKIYTELEPESLLDELQAIETEQGRERVVRWGPRTVDLDLLLYADQEIRTKRLTVPHAELTQRNFVLLPLADIAPELSLPNGQTLKQALELCPSNRIQRLPSAARNS